MEQANKLKELGNKEFAAKNFVKAIGFYTQAIALHENEVFFVNRASCYLNLDKLEQAIQDANRGVALNPQYSKSYMRLYEAFMRQGDFEKAKDVLLRGKQMCPQDIALIREIDSISILITYRDTYIKNIEEKNFSDALRKINMLLEKCTDTIEYYSAKTHVLCLMNDAKSAESFLIEKKTKVHKLKEETYHLLLAVSYKFQNKLAEAKSAALQAISVDGSYSDAKTVLETVKKMDHLKTQANTAFTTKKYQEALNLYSEAGSTDPENRLWNSVIASNKASCLMSLGKKKEALTEMNKCVQLDESNGKFFYKKGKLEMELGEMESAEKSMIKAKNLDSTLTIDNDIKKVSSKVKEMNKKDFYAILGVKKEATLDEIKKAYKELVRKWHPDKHVNNPESKDKADRKFKEINEAYNVLSDPKKKQMYDHTGGSTDDFDNGGFNMYNAGGRGGMAGGFPMSQVFQMFFNDGSNNNFSFGSGGQSNPFEGFGADPFGGANQNLFNMFGRQNTGGRGGSRRGK